MSKKRTNAEKFCRWHIILRYGFGTICIVIFGFSLGFAATVLHQKNERRTAQGNLLHAGFQIILGDREAHIPWQNEKQFANDLRKAFPEAIKSAKSAGLRNKGGVLIIEKDESGSDIHMAKILQDITRRLSTLSRAPIEAEILTEMPEIREEDIRINLSKIRSTLLAPITLVGNESKEIVRPWDFFASLTLQKQTSPWLPFANTDNKKNTKIYIHIESETFDSYAQKTWGHLNRQADHVKIHLNEAGKPVFEGKGKSGKTLQIQELRILLEQAINSSASNEKIQFPIQEEPFQVVADPALQAKGIKEVIGIGHTTFYGSPTNRIFNIGVGIRKFNGVFIAPNEIFSFNTHLGPVDDAHGFRKELVIKPEGTLPEFGGGLCQVSTTAYRAALYTGLPIVERSPHSYAVGYYAQVGGHGIDATIYPGARDLKFRNDTGNSILIQAYVEESEAYFILYGTKDGRTVKMDGPYISNRHSEEGTETIQTTEIPAGTKKQVEKAHVGFDTIWYRFITGADGLTSKETIESRYRATKDKILIGVTSEEYQKLQMQTPEGKSTKSDNKNFGD